MTALIISAIVVGAILILGGIHQLMIEYNPAGWWPLSIGVLLAAAGVITAVVTGTLTHALTHWP